MKNVKTFPSPYRIQWVEGDTFDKTALIYGLQKQLNGEEQRVLDLVILGRVALDNLREPLYAVVMSVWYRTHDTVVPVRLDVTASEINRYIETGIITGEQTTNLAA